MAEAPTMEVRARLTAETAQFTRGIENARKSVETLSTASSQLRGSMLAIGVASGTAAAALIAFGTKSFMAAARVDELNVALNAVGKSTGKGYKALSDTALAIKAMGIEMEVAQKATLKYAQNNLDLSKASEVARVAQDLAVIGAMNSTDAFDRLTHAIITGRSEVLKSVGIQKSAGAAYADYARSIGKTAKELNYEEKQAAVLNLVLEEGARVAGTYEAAMTTPGKVLRSFARLHNNLQVAVGGVLVNAIGPMIFETYELYKTFIKAVEGGGRFQSMLQGTERVLVTLTTPITNFIKGLKDAITKFNDAKISIKGFAEQLQVLLPVIAAVGAYFATVAGKQIFALVPIFGSILGKLNPLMVAFVAITATSSQMQKAVAKLFAALQPLIQPLLQIGKIAGGVAGYAIAILAKAIEGVAKIISGTISFIQKYSGVFKVLGAVIGAVAGGYLAYRGAILLTTAATTIWATVTTAATAVTKGFQAAMALLNLTIAFNPIPLIIGALVALVIAFAAAWKNSETFRTVMTNVFNTVAKVVGKVLAGVVRSIGYFLIGLGKLISTHNAFGKVVANVLQFIWGAFLTVMIGIVKLVKFVIDAFIVLMENQGILGQIIEAVVNFIIKAYLTYVKVVLSVVKNVIEAFISLMENHAVFRNIVEEVFNSIIRIIALAVTAVVTSFANILKGVATVIYVFEKLFSVVKTIAGAIVSAIGAMATGIGNLVRSAFAFIVEKFLAKLVEKVRDFVDFLAGAAKKIPIVGGAISSFFAGMSSELNKATGELKSFGQEANNIGEQQANASKKSIDLISGVSTAMIENAKGWGNYSTGVAGKLSSIANSLLDFNQKIVNVAAQDNGAKLVDSLITGAKKAVPLLESMISKIDDTLQVNFGKALVDTLVSGAKLASEGLGKMIDEMEKLKDVKVGDFVETVSENAIKAGEFLVGLAGGIESFTGSDFVGNLGDAFSGLIDKLKEGLGFGDILAAEKKKFEEAAASDTGMTDAVNQAQDTADQIKRIREAMTGAIDGIKDVIQDLKDAAKEFADSLKDTIMSFAGLKSVELPDGFIPKAKSLIENMQMRLNKSTQFANQIAQLHSLGLDANAIRDLLEEGPLKGAQLAASILSGGKEAIDQINALQKGIEYTGAALGQYGADITYGGMIANAQQTYSDLAAAELSIRGATAGSPQVFVQQGAVQIVVDASMTNTAEEMADVVTAEINRVFGTLAKELSAK